VSPLPFPEYAPDLSPFGAEESQTIINVVPRADGYGPVSGPSVYSAALASACRGAFCARNADGSISIFAGTSTKLHKLNNTNFTWTDVSKGASTYTTLPAARGGEYGLITQDSCIRRMIYAPGSSYVFQIERVAQDKGIFAPLSLVRGGDRLFFAGNDGFQLIAPAAYPAFIGKEKVDRTFFADVDGGNLQLALGAYEPKSTRVYFAYKSQAGSAGLFDKVFVHDFALQKWSSITGISGEYILPLARPGLTLEGLDSISGSIDALTFSLDDVVTSPVSYLAIFDSSHRLNFLSGANLEATLDTAEHEIDGGRRARVKGFRPDTDAATAYGSIGARETIQASPSYSSEQLVNGKGLCPANVSTRLARGRLRIPAGTTWSFATGIEPQFAQEGKR